MGDAGEAMGFHATLVEVRGDWDMYSKILHFPYHGENDTICWLCNCRRCEKHEAQANARWRRPENRYSKDAFIQAQIRRGAAICPLLTIPGMSNTCFRIDWLHAVDKGVAADAQGNIFYMILQKLPGTKDAKLKQLWDAINDIYEEQERLGNKITERLKKLKWEQIQSQHQADMKAGENHLQVR